MEFTWEDFNLNRVINTKDGEGVIQAIDKKSNIITVSLHDNGETKSYSLSDVSYGFGQIKLSHCTNIGEFILLFQRLENRLRDFLNYVYDFRRTKASQFTSGLTAGRLRDKISYVFKTYEPSDILEEWKAINSKISKLVDSRNSIIHGHLYHFNDDMDLDYNTLYFKNPTGKTQQIDSATINNLTRSVMECYYRSHTLFAKHADEIKAKIKTADNKS
ncbi:hypothetical protein [Fulvivirga ligni]|uniref:hypothetical protein n=1 Tax=Fulvivirga ligni TaxID=2904246 RepID=UPI001F36B9C0|nr:hypothetical protein [Fulvivirga ligni]UII21185.1 hypothetical protein LVD16_25445 [Fulvivirga ligni]